MCRYFARMSSTQCRVCNIFWIHLQYLHYWSWIFAYKKKFGSKVMEGIVTTCFLSGFYSIYFGFAVFWIFVWPMLPIFSSQRLDVGTAGSHQTTVLAPQWNLPKRPSDSFDHLSVFYMHCSHYSTWKPIAFFRKA